MGWARFLERVFDIDLEHCPQCGGAFRIIAAIAEPAVIVKILTHLGCLRAPRRAPPRGRWRFSRQRDLPKARTALQRLLTISRGTRLCAANQRASK